MFFFANLGVFSDLLIWEMTPNVNVVNMGESKGLQYLITLSNKHSTQLLLLAKEVTSSNNSTDCIQYVMHPELASKPPFTPLFPAKPANVPDTNTRACVGFKPSILKVIRQALDPTERQALDPTELKGTSLQSFGL
jgi:hypothetical protein